MRSDSLWTIVLSLLFVEGSVHRVHIPTVVSLKMFTCPVVCRMSVYLAFRSVA